MQKINHITGTKTTPIKVRLSKATFIQTFSLRTDNKENIDHSVAQNKRRHIETAPMVLRRLQNSIVSMEETIIDAQENIINNIVPNKV